MKRIKLNSLWQNYDVIYKVVKISDFYTLKVIATKHGPCYGWNIVEDGCEYPLPLRTRPIEQYSLTKVTPKSIGLKLWLLL